MPWREFMKRNIIVAVSIITVGIVALGVLVPIFNSVRITAPMIGIPLIISRNGQEVPPNQIRSVQYHIDVHVTQPPQDVRNALLQEANYTERYYVLGAPFSIYRTGSIVESTEIKPQYRSIFLRITFTDGKIISMSCPIISDTHENLPLYVDLSDASQ